MKQKRKTTKPSLLDRLNESCDGLIYISETDAPVAPFIGEGMKDTKPGSLFEYLRIEEKPQVLTSKASEFFDRLSAEKDWYTSEQRRNAKKFGELKRIFEKELRDTSVIRLGRIQIDIYAIGLDSEGKVLGIKTRAVET